VRGEETSSAKCREFETTLVVGAKSERRYASLRDKGFTEFVTQYVSRREWSGHEKKPLFPSYLFRRFKLSDLFAILNRFGLIHVVSAGKKPLGVVFEQACMGERVRSTRGFLKSIEGLVVRVSDLRIVTLW
jgi:hypothetical protein